MNCTNVINIILSCLSFLLALLSIIFVIITLNQNKKILETNKSQIEEMKQEHKLSTQPILVLNKTSFIINRPRFYYTPPEDKYSFLSTYEFSAEINNVSNVAAIKIDVTANLRISIGKQIFELSACSERCNIIPGNQTYSPINILFAGDETAKIFDSLREKHANNLPKICVQLIYSNATGGYFINEYHYILAPSDTICETIKSWHTNIMSAPISFKSELKKLEKTKFDDSWSSMFNKVKENFSNTLDNTETTELKINCIEIPEKYKFSAICKEEYIKNINEHQYGRYIHNLNGCSKEEK